MGVGSDKRRAEWAIKDAALKDIAECFKNNAALCSALETNTNTWRKLEQGGLVKREVVKEILSTFLTLLSDIKTGKEPIDSGKHHKSDIDRATKKYLGAGPAAEWGDLAEHRSDAT